MAAGDPLSVPASAMGRATVGQARHVGDLIAMMHAAEWEAARDQAARIHGAGTFALADSFGNTPSGNVSGGQAAAGLLGAVTTLTEKQRSELIAALKKKLAAQNHPGQLAPALLALVETSDTGPLEKVYLAARSDAVARTATATARTAALGLVSVAVRARFWASFNLAYTAPPGASASRDPADLAAELAEETAARRELLEASEIAIQAACARGRPAELEALCDHHIAAATRLSGALSLMLARATRIADDSYAAGRDNTGLRHLSRTGADGLHLARKAWAGIVGAHLLQLPGWRSDPKHPVARLVRSAPAAPPFTSVQGLRSVTTLAKIQEGADVRVEGRVLALESERIERGRKLVTTATLGVGKRRPALNIRAEYHNLGHEGLTVGAYLSATGSTIDVAGTRMLRVRRLPFSDVTEVGWVAAWHGTARIWAELFPGALDLLWSPGRAAKRSDESEGVGFGAGDVLFNKPFAAKGRSYV